MSEIKQRKAGAASVDPEDYNAVVDAVSTLEDAGGGISELTSVDESVTIVADGTSRDLSAGGGSQPQQEIIDNGGTAVPPGGDNLPFVHASGDALLDYTSPTQPTVIAAGTYAITLTSNIDPTDATVLTLQLGLPVNSPQTAAPVDVNVAAYYVTVSAVVKLGAGDAINAVLTHNNTGSRTCQMTAYIVKLA